jgi:hypothetical protein
MCALIVPQRYSFCIIGAHSQRGSSDLVMNLQRYIDDKKGPGEETSQSEESSQ